MSPRGGRGGRAVCISSIARLGVTDVIAVSPCREAREEDNDGREEQQNHRGEDRPHASTEGGVASAFIAVNFVLHYAERHEVDDHNNQGEDPGESSDDRRKESATDTGTECEEEGDERETAADRVQDHDVGESIGGVRCCRTIVGAIDEFHFLDDGVADLLLGAVVLVGAERMLAVVDSTIREVATYFLGATSRTHQPKVPKETAELRILLALVRWTFSMLKSLTTGAVMVVMRRSMDAAKSKNVPTWWKSPVLAILLKLALL